MKVARSAAAQAVLISGPLFVGLFVAEAAGQNRDNLANWCGPSLHVGESSLVTLTGTIIRESELGPPGFGEHPATDTRFTAWILELDYRVPIAAAEAAPPFAVPKTITRIQLRGGTTGNERYDDFVNRHVSVRGTLSSWIAPSDVTPIVIQPAQVRISGPARCDGSEAPPKT
jgi:hypothetical protein